ncbi:MAG: hypothetical protein E6K62_09230 [Nitrospirae bacterium]|nr:MAG: hypothetical protein E6K62_09230 [Nitrospirota bacterium]
MYVEVESNPNYGNSVFLRFRELGPARPVGQVRVYDRVSTGEWCRVTGWQNEASAPLCRAVAQPVEDSGAGVVYLVSGGNGGIRLKPLEPDEAWNLENPRQWGEAYLLLADRRDVCFADEPD